MRSRMVLAVSAVVAAAPLAIAGGPWNKYTSFYVPAEPPASQPAKNGAAKPADKSADKADMGKKAAVPQDAKKDKAVVAKTDKVAAEHEDEEFGFREAGDFNIREANPDEEKGEWSLDLEFGWGTKKHNRGDDDTHFRTSLGYGLTEDTNIELEVLPINLGDGGDQGAGDLAIMLFQRLVRETASVPAIGTWVEMRLPTGEGSDGVDAEWHLNVTKTLMPKFRAHLEGFIATVNGVRGDDDIDYRNFQWGVGPGFDYQIDEKTLAAINYLNRSSEEYGHTNQHILQVGLVRTLTESQHLQFTVDVGLGGREETDALAAKILWSIDFK